jgi:hypothetical protein
MNLRKSVQTSIPITIERLVIAEPQGFIIESLTAAGHEILSPSGGMTVPADLFSPMSLGVRLNVSLWTNEHLIIIVRNIDVVPRIFSAAAIYKVS